VHPPTTVCPDTPLRDAIARMLEGNIGAVLVVDAGGKLLAASPAAPVRAAAASESQPTLRPR